MMALELVAFSIFIVAFFAIVVHNLFLLRRKRKLLSLIVQLETDKDILMSKLSEALATKDSVANVEQSEGFLNFISESRDWAFKYIEDVQEAIAEFGKKIGPEIKYLRNYSSVLGLTATKGIEKISEAYEQLLKVMPEASDDKDQQQR
jgi:hypothetical protein